VTDIQWSTDDALPFPVCVSSTYLNNDTETQLNNVSLSTGNIVLAIKDIMLSVPLGLCRGRRSSIRRTRATAANPRPDSVSDTLPSKVPDSSITQAVPFRGRKSGDRERGAADLQRVREFD